MVQNRMDKLRVIFDLLLDRMLQPLSFTCLAGQVRIHDKCVPDISPTIPGLRARPPVFFFFFFHNARFIQFPPDPFFPRFASNLEIPPGGTARRISAISHVISYSRHAGRTRGRKRVALNVRERRTERERQDLHLGEKSESRRGLRVPSNRVLTGRFHRIYRVVVPPPPPSLSLLLSFEFDHGM